MTGFGKNVIPRRAHKERAQPQGRVARHGLLEKKKDWKLRAKNRNRKEARVKLLKEKAAFRNPDEFYHGMISSAGTSSGRARKTRDVQDAIPMAERDAEQRILAGQRDSGYVAMKEGLERGKLESLKKGLHFLEKAAETPRTHTVFVEDEKDVVEFSEVAHVESVSAQRGEGTFVKGINRLKKGIVKKRKKAYLEYEQRLERKEKLRMVLQDIDLEKKLLGKGARRRVREADDEKGTPAVFKWRKQRKR